MKGEAGKKVTDGKQIDDKLEELFDTYKSKLISVGSAERSGLETALLVWTV